MSQASTFFWDHIMFDSMPKPVNCDCEIEPLYTEYIHRDILESDIAQDFYQHIEGMTSNQKVLQAKKLLRSKKIKSLSFSYGSMHAVFVDNCEQVVRINFTAIEKKTWSYFVEKFLDHSHCLDEILNGEIPSSIQDLICDSDNLIFPTDEQISIKCSCTAGNLLCKHALAVLFTIPVFIDEDPFIIFKLRQKNLASDLICKAAVECANSTYSDFNSEMLEKALSISFG